MNFTLIFGIFAIGAFGLQALMGFHQIKNFNSVYMELKRKGRVAIGKKPGKLRLGTIVLLNLDNNDKIIDARIMQGATILARFKPLEGYIGEDIHFIDRVHPKVQEENKLTQLALEEARNVFLQVELGHSLDEEPESPFQKVASSLGKMKDLIFNKVKRSV